MPNYQYTLLDNMVAARQIATLFLAQEGVANVEVVLGNRLQADRGKKIYISLESVTSVARGLLGVEVSYNCYASTMKDSFDMAQAILDRINQPFLYGTRKITCTLVDVYQDMPDGDDFKTSVSVRLV
jgi:hypothetical protein